MRLNWNATLPSCRVAAVPREVHAHVGDGARRVVALDQRDDVGA
jgi:hypothetical protein